MPRTALTDLSVRSLEVEEGQVDFWDTKTPGFGVRVGLRQKTFVSKLRNRRISLGTFPRVSLQEARKKHHGLKAADAAPLPSTPFKDALAAFLEIKERQLKPRSYRELKRTLERHFPFTAALNKITHDDVAKKVEAIEAKHEAAHALKDIKTFFNWCVPRYISHSPCNGLKPPVSYTPRTRVLTDDEIKKIWNAAATMGSYGIQVQLLIATGQRANQIISLKREWIDEKQRTILFPAAIMKGNRDHLIPYGDLAAPLLTVHQPSSYQGKKKKDLDKLSRVAGYTLHDFRRYYSSTQPKLKTPIDITEAILSHLSGSRSEIQRIYDLYDRLNEMRDAVLRYENWLKSLVGLARS